MLPQFHGRLHDFRGKVMVIVRDGSGGRAKVKDAADSSTLASSRCTKSMDAYTKASWLLAINSRPFSLKFFTSKLR